MVSRIKTPVIIEGGEINKSGLMVEIQRIQRLIIGLIGEEINETIPSIGMDGRIKGGYSDEEYHESINAGLGKAHQKYLEALDKQGPLNNLMLIALWEYLLKLEDVLKELPEEVNKV